MSDKNPFANMDMVYAYTRRQAIADGVLHDVSEIAKRSGFSIPVAVTDTIWGRYIDPNSELVEYGQSCEARLLDLLMVLYFKIRSLPRGSSNSRITFTVKFLMNAEKEEYEETELTADCGPVIPHKGGFMSKATAFTLGFVTGAAALGAAAYLAKGWTSEEDEDEDEDEVTQPINDTGSRENGIDDSATSPDLESAQESETPDAPKTESSSATYAEASPDITDEEPNAPA